MNVMSRSSASEVPLSATALAVVVCFGGCTINFDDLTADGEVNTGDIGNNQGDEDKPAVGTEGGACTPGGSCDPGLTCASSFCVRIDAGEEAGEGEGEGEDEEEGSGGGEEEGDGQGEDDVDDGEYDGPVYSSCADAKDQDPAAASGVFRIQTGGATPTNSMPVYCDMDSDGGGWTLAAKVHRFHDGMPADEPDGWFARRADAASLLDNNSYDDRPVLLASHGRNALQAMATSAQLARFVVIAEDNPSQRAEWFKEVAPDLWNWFSTAEHTETNVCTDVDMTANCSSGRIRSRSVLVGHGSLATPLEGMSLSAYGYPTGGDLHMRLNTDEANSFSGVCSWTGGPGSGWQADAIDGQWGSGLEIWLR